MDLESTKICIVGIWHQGAVASACLADAGYTVIGVDQDQTRVDDLNRGRAPLFEPGLDELLKSGLQSGRLSFTTNIAEGLNASRNVFMMFDTPVDENDDVDLTEIFATSREIAPHLSPDSLILVTAQVPIGSCELIEETIRKSNPQADFMIAYSPENLRLGEAIVRFKTPPLPVIGSDHQEALKRLELLFAPLHSSWMRVNLRTAEMIKHGLNAFLAVSICFANELGNLCDELGADAQQIAAALRLEPRIGSKAMLFPGLGFSGGTLARDMKTLQRLGDSLGYETYLIDGAWKTNVRQNQLVVSKLRKILGPLDGLKIGVLGLTYKPNTSTLRRSASIEIIREMVSQNASVRACDPKADREELKAHLEFQVCEDAYAVAENCDALVLITPWPEFKDLDFKRLRSVMKRPLIFDTQNLLDPSRMSESGFTYLGIGRGLATRNGNHK
jgi:UDPglucose 6-dehydrogenase